MITMELNHETIRRVRELGAIVSAPWRAMLNASPVSVAAGQARDESRRFLDPRGAIIDAAVDSVLHYVAGECDMAVLGKSLAPYMKLQALEVSSAEKAVAFLAKLKALFRDAVEIVGRQDLQEAARAIELGMDEVMEIAAGMYRNSRLLLVDLGNDEKRRIAVRNLRNVRQFTQPDGESTQ
jgi:hypothetical protein